MKRLLKWSGAALGAFVLVLACVVAYVWVASDGILSATHEAPESNFVADLDSADLEEGKRAAILRGCYDGCHGRAADGTVFSDDLVLGLIVTPNQTQAFSSMSDAELDRSIRHGVRRDGTSNLVMPSAAFHNLTDADFNNIVAFIRSLPLTDGAAAQLKPGIGARAFLVIEAFEPQVTTLEALGRRIDPARLPDNPMESGEYIAVTVCAECHGLDFQGREHFAPSLLASWAYGEAGFRRLMREGVGLGERDLGLMTEVSRARFHLLTDEEIERLRLFLRTLQVPEVEST